MTAPEKSKEITISAKLPSSLSSKADRRRVMAREIFDRHVNSGKDTSTILVEALLSLDGVYLPPSSSERLTLDSIREMMESVLRSALSNINFAQPGQGDAIIEEFNNAFQDSIIKSARSAFDED